MNITQNDIDALNATLNVSLTTEDYSPKVKQALNKLKKTVSMKGFRAGKVPESLIKKMYGTSVLVDELNKLVNDSINEYIKENELEILGRPIPVTTEVDFDIQNLKDYEFVFELGLSPKFEIPVLNAKTVVKAPKVIIDDELLQNELNRIQDSYGNMSFPEEGIEEKDLLQVKFVELDHEEQPKEEGVESSGTINLETVSNKTLKGQLMKGKIGTTIVAKNLFNSIDREREQIVKYILNLEHEPEDMGKAFELTIEKISRRERAELNQEFFDKVFGPGNVESEEEAKEKLRKDLSNYVSQSENGKLNEKIYTLLIEETPIELPDEFLRKWIKASNEKPISDEEIEKEYPEFAKNLKWSLIVNKLTKDGEIKAEFEDISEYSKQTLRAQFQQFSPDTFTEEDLDSLNMNMLQKEDHMKQTFDAVMEQKLFSFIKQQITIEEEAVSFEDFFKA